MNEAFEKWQKNAIMDCAYKTQAEREAIAFRAGMLAAAEMERSKGK